MLILLHYLFYLLFIRTIIADCYLDLGAQHSCCWIDSTLQSNCDFSMTFPDSSISLSPNSPSATITFQVTKDSGSRSIVCPYQNTTLKACTSQRCDPTDDRGVILKENDIKAEIKQNDNCVYTVQFSTNNLDPGKYWLMAYVVSKLPPNDNLYGIANIIGLEILQPPPNNNWLLPVAISIGICVLIILSIVIYIAVVRRRKSKLYEVDLHPEINWFFYIPRLLKENYEAIHNDSGELLYYRKFVDKENSKEWKLFDYLSMNLDFEEIVIGNVYAVVSPKIATSFINHKKLQIKRKQEAPMLFVSTKWKSKDELGLRKFTMDKFEEKIAVYLWNKTEDEKLCPILPAVCAADKDIVWQIVTTGFSKLAMNTGIYGSGIYLNTSAQYSVPHWINKQSPVILICLTLPGYPYPVIEHPSTNAEIRDKGLTQGHQSHYVLTQPNGEPITSIYDKYYDELILDQEGQVIPIFVVEVSSPQKDQLQKRFIRKFHTPSVMITPLSVDSPPPRGTSNESDEPDYRIW